LNDNLSTDRDNYAAGADQCAADQNRGWGVWSNFTRATICAHRKNGTT